MSIEESKPDHLHSMHTLLAAREPKYTVFRAVERRNNEHNDSADE